MVLLRTRGLNGRSGLLTARDARGAPTLSEGEPGVAAGVMSRLLLFSGCYGAADRGIVRPDPPAVPLKK